MSQQNNDLMASFDSSHSETPTQPNLLAKFVMNVLCQIYEENPLIPKSSNNDANIFVMASGEIMSERSAQILQIMGQKYLSCQLEVLPQEIY